MRNHLGLETAICYNAFNMVGSVTDANGIATEYTYGPAGLVTRIVRRDGADVMTSLEVTYDSAGRPVSMKDQDGPNHAAALICAVMPLFWGWRTRRALAAIASLGLLVMLALTYSRAGFVVLAFESVAWAALTRRLDKVRVFSALAALAVLVAWLSPRINLDGAILPTCRTA